MNRDIIDDVIALEAREAEKAGLHSDEDEDNVDDEEFLTKARINSPSVLPEIAYKSSRLALEKEVRQGLPASHGTLPKAFGKAHVDEEEATIIKHLGRERIPADLDLGEAGLMARRERKDLNLPAKIVASTQSRESMLANESAMEMSVREVKKIHL